MTTNSLKALIYSHSVLAGMHGAIAFYFQAVEEGASPDRLQTLWHDGFEYWGPAFAEAIDKGKEFDHRHR